MKFKYKVRRDKHVKADFLCLILILKCFLLQFEYRKYNSYLKYRNAILI